MYATLHIFTSIYVEVSPLALKISYMEKFKDTVYLTWYQSHITVSLFTYPAMQNLKRSCRYLNKWINLLLMYPSLQLPQRRPNPLGIYEIVIDYFNFHFSFFLEIVSVPHRLDTVPSTSIYFGVYLLSFGEKIYDSTSLTNIILVKY